MAPTDETRDAVNEAGIALIASTIFGFVAGHLRGHNADLNSWVAAQALSLLVHLVMWFVIAWLRLRFGKEVFNSTIGRLIRIAWIVDGLFLLVFACEIILFRV